MKKLRNVIILVFAFTLVPTSVMGANNRTVSDRDTFYGTEVQAPNLNSGQVGQQGSTFKRREPASAGSGTENCYAKSPAGADQSAGDNNGSRSGSPTGEEK